MTVTISLTPEVERALAEKARLSGVDVQTYIAALVERDVLASRSLDALLAPLREQVAASGLSEHDLDALLSEAREAASRARASGSP